MTYFCGIKGDHNGRFSCGILFGFNPPVCVQAPPKIHKLFLGKRLEECREIAEAHGFEFKVYETYPDPRRRRD